MREPLIVTLSVVCTLKGEVTSHVEMVNTKDQRNALCIVFAMLFVNIVDTKIKACNAFNAMYVDTVDTKHIHTFLPITFLIFN